MMELFLGGRGARATRGHAGLLVVAVHAVRDTGERGGGGWREGAGNTTGYLSEGKRTVGCLLGGRGGADSIRRHRNPWRVVRTVRSGVRDPGAPPPRRTYPRLSSSAPLDLTRRGATLTLTLCDVTLRWRATRDREKKRRYLYARAAPRRIDATSAGTSPGGWARDPRCVNNFTLNTECRPVQEPSCWVGTRIGGRAPVFSARLVRCRFRSGYFWRWRGGREHRDIKYGSESSLFEISSEYFFKFFFLEKYTHAYMRGESFRRDKYLVTQVLHLVIIHCYLHFLRILLIFFLKWKIYVQLNWCILYRILHVIDRPEDSIGEKHTQQTPNNSYITVM